METVRQTRKPGEDLATPRNGLEAPCLDTIGLMGEYPATEKVLAFYSEVVAWARRALSFRAALLSVSEAKSLLERNTTNRPKSPSTIDRYSHYVRSGQFRINGECIILDPLGNMLDGQHRCEAIVAADMPAPVCIVTGVDAEAFKTLNQGKLRNAADVFSIMGEANGATLSSAIHWLHRFETNSMLAQIRKLSNMEMAQLLGEFPGIRASVESVRPRCRKGIHSAGPLSFLHFMCTGRHPDYEWFFDRILTGANLPEGSPVFLLYRQISDRDNRMGAAELIAKTIKAWNATVAGQSPKSLRWGKDEAFPKIS